MRFPVGGIIGNEATVKIAVGAADASATLKAGVVYRVMADTDCFLRVGVAAVADAPSMPVIANQPEEMQFGPSSEADPVVHVLQKAAGGKIYFTPMVR